MTNAGRLGVVAALEIEARWLGTAATNLEIRRAGVGRASARRIAADLIDTGADALVSWGSAGGLAPALAAGDLILPETVVDEQGGCWEADPVWRARLLRRTNGRIPVNGGRQLCVATVAGTPEAKAELHERFQAVAVDMESAGLAEVALDHGVPWIAVKVVVDTADEAVPAVLAGVSDPLGRLRPAALLGLALRPWVWPALSRLGSANWAAGRSMKRLVRLAPDLERV
jgi:hypothetical protein